MVEPFAFMGNGSPKGFIDERTYTIAYTQVPNYVEVTKALAKPIIDDAGWQLIGYFSSITGKINQVVHLWYWDSQGDREERQMKAVTDPRWQLYQAANGHRVIDQQEPLPGAHDVLDRQIVTEKPKQRSLRPVDAATMVLWRKRRGGTIEV